jgi:hypothetical protein
MVRNLSDASWSSLPWKQFRDKLFHIQCKIYKAKQEGNFKKLYSLQKLLIESQTTHYIAIKDITHLIFESKSTLLNLTSVEKFDLSVHLKEEIRTWIYDSRKSFNIKDLIVLYIWRLSLDPVYVTSFFQKTCKVSSNQLALNLQRKILNTLKVNSKERDKKIIRIELGNIFSIINYKLVIQKLHFPNLYKVRLFKSLIKGLLTSVSPLEGYPKSDPFIFSSLLKIILLKDIETIASPKGILLGIRYKCDILYILPLDYDSRLALDGIRLFLKSNVGHLLDNKISVTTSLTGFEFLYWYFRVKKNGRVLSYPNKYNFNKQKRKIQTLLKSSRYKLEVRIYKVKVIFKEWSRYNRFCELSEIKPKLYYLKLWVIKYLKKSSSLSKEKRLAYLKMVFE